MVEPKLIGLGLCYNVMFYHLLILDRDLTLLPIRNVTVEELAHYLLETLLKREEIAVLDIHQMVLRCASGEGQWASASWACDA